MSRNKVEAAEKSLRFYKSCTDTSSKENNERFETEKAKLHSTVKANEERGEKLVWADFSKLSRCLLQQLMPPDTKFVTSKRN